MLFTETVDLILTASSFPSFPAFSAADPCLILCQFILLDPEDIFLLFGHGFFERRILPSGLASRPSWMYVSVFLRRIGLITDVQVNAFNLVIFVVPSGRWEIFRS